MTERRPNDIDGSELEQVCDNLRREGWDKDALEISETLGVELKLTGPSAPVAATGGDKVYVATARQIVSSLQFRQLGDEGLKRASFRQAVRQVDLEIFSECNRRCHYCSNSVVDRHSTNVAMSDQHFDRIVEDLASIDYDRDIRFIGYNESTMHRAMLVGRLRQLRARLPKAKIIIFSNGDYLNGEYMEELRLCGVNEMRISIHLQPLAPYSDSEMLHRIMLLSNKLGTSPVIQSFVKNTSIRAHLPYRDVKITMFHGDYENIGHDRGGVLPDIGRKNQDRHIGCIAPVQMIVFSYNGNVLPCCHFVGDYAGHQDMVIGNLSDFSSIFDIYDSPSYVAWRKGMFAYGPKTGPCKTCYDFEDDPMMRDAEFFDGMTRPEGEVDLVADRNHSPYGLRIRRRRRPAP